MTYSAYLPDNYDATKPVALIAGKGVYPELMAASIRSKGLPLRLIAFDEETREGLIGTFAENERQTIKVGQLGHMLKALKRFGCGYAIMAGQITPKKLFKGLHPDLKAARILFSLKRRNAETIFGAIAKEIADIDITLLDARSFLDDELAHTGVMTGGKFPIDEEYVAHGLHIARESARLDIGQGCVVRKGTVLAVEAFEGTDAMIERAGTFKTDQALLVKTVKARQDYRFDVPCFGLRTLEGMHTSGIMAAVLEGGRVIMLEKKRVIERARELGICLMGVD